MSAAAAGNHKANNRVSSEILDRLPPHDELAERNVLGCMLTDNSTIDAVWPILSPEDFYSSANAIIYRRMLKMHTEGEPLDITILYDRLKQNGEFETAGGHLHLGEIASAPAIPANIDHYSQLVKEKSVRRSMIHAAGEVMRNAFDHDVPTKDLVATHGAAVESIAARLDATREPDLFPTVTCRELATANYELEYLVEHAVVAGQPLIIGGPKKNLKSCIVVDLALSLATGGYFLGKFKVNRCCPVAVMSGEGGMATLQKHALRVAAAANCSLEFIDNLVWSPKLPRFGDVSQLRSLRTWLKKNGSKILMLDCAYLCLPAGADNGNLFAMGSLLASINDLCQEAGVTLILVHHTKALKDPFAPAELGDLAWSGFAEFARQWVILSRREIYKPDIGVHRLWLNIGGSAGHSSLWGLDVDEGVYDGETPRRWDVSLTTADEVRQGAEERQQQAKADKSAEASAVQSKKILDLLAKHSAGLTKTDLRDLGGISMPKVNASIAALLESGDVQQVELTKGNRQFDGFQLAGEAHE